MGDLLQRHLHGEGAHQGQHAGRRLRRALPRELAEGLRRAVATLPSVGPWVSEKLRSAMLEGLAKFEKKSGGQEEGEEEEESLAKVLWGWTIVLFIGYFVKDSIEQFAQLRQS